jgi:hypothetical protein
MNLPVENLTGLGNILPEGIENIPMLKGIAHNNNETVLILDPERLFYNRNGIAQGPPVALGASAGDDTPVHSNTPVEPALVTLPPEKKITAKKQPAAKKTLPEKSAPVEETPVMKTSAPSEELPVITTSAPEATPATKAGTPADDSPEQSLTDP